MKVDTKGGLYKVTLTQKEIKELELYLYEGFGIYSGYILDDMYIDKLAEIILNICTSA